MQYPQLTEYTNAIINAADNFDKLSNLRPVMDNRGEPSRNIGGFAVVFKMQDKDTGRMYAIKCFHEEQIGRNEAYNAISQTLRNIKSPYLMEVNYLPKELFVDTAVSDETEFPVLMMDWIDGVTMDTFIQAHYRDKLVMKRLYEKFCDLALWIRTQQFAHGDIKPDNIMIKNDGSLILVDYDGMFVPSMAGSLSPTLGTKGFSHPLRTNKDFNNDIDDFTLANISISLLAMSEDTSLYSSHGAPERLLFSDEDYTDFANSKIYNELKTLGGIFPKLLELFTECLKTNNGNTALYDKIFDLQTKAPEIHIFECINADKVYEEDVITLRWDVDNATQISINGFDVSGKNEYKTKVKQDSNYELKVTNGLKDSSRKITVNVLKKASVSLKSNSLKLKKGKEKNINLTWNIKNSQSAVLFIENKEYPIKPNGKMSVEIEQSTTIKLRAMGLDGERAFEKILRINVFSESEVSFTADKYYSLPNVPIRLSWNVSHAKDIELVGVGTVNATGEYIFTPKETTIYILKVKDAFGTQEHPLKIQMLPIPYVKTLEIPTPQINNTWDIKVTIPTPKVNVSLHTNITDTTLGLGAKTPNIDVMNVKLNAPFAKDFISLNINSKLNTEITKRIKKHFSLWANIKNIYSYYKHKISNHER